MKKLCPLALTAAVSAGLIACSSSPSGPPPKDVTVTWSDVKQSIDGFGASSAFFGGNISDATADQLFDAKKGLGLSLLRMMIGIPDDTGADGSEPTTGAMPIATAPELTTAQQAAARGTQVWAAAWTPPPIWKTTNNKNGSGTDYTSNKLDPAHYQDYATYLADFVDLMATSTPPVKILGVSPANEPDYTATWDNAQWAPDDITTFVGQYMGPTFATREPSVKIITPETANWPDLDGYVTSLLADTTTAGYVPVIATHPYGMSTSGGDLNYDKPQMAGKQFWETEYSQENPNGDTPDPTMTSAMGMAQLIHGAMVTTGMNAWNWWAVYITKDGLNDPLRMNPAFIQPSVQADGTLGDPYMFKRGYAFGNWSKFVRPGFQRIGATDLPTPDTLIEAYRDSSHIAVVAVNTGTTAVPIKVHLDGGTFGTVTPWVTSADKSLEAASSMSATDSFTFTLPATSVVTFVNWDATTETPGLENLPPIDGGISDGIASGLDCTNALVPNNGTSGGVTDFTDWHGSTGKWGNIQGLNGSVYSYMGPKGSTMDATVDTVNKDMHVTGGVVASDYGGAGLGFNVCTTVTSFSQIEFTISGSWPGCDVELQIKTFDQQPTNQSPAGGCDPSGSCYNFPVVKQVAVSPIDGSTTVTVPLSDFTGWSATNAAEVVGLQWQWTGTNVDPDASAGCPIDVAITDVKFLP